MFKIKRNQKGAATDPAQLVGSVEQAANIVRENLTWLVAGIVVAVVAGLAVGGFFWTQQQQDRAAADLLREGTRNVPGRPMETPSRRAEESRKAIESFKKVLAEYPRSPAAPQAAYLLGNALSDLKDWDGAVKAYQEFLARYGDHGPFVPLVYLRLAYVQLSQGKTEDAQKTLSALLKIEGALNKDQALYELAKIDEIMNRPEAALPRYQEIVKVHPHSPFAEEAAIRIKTLDARKASQATPTPPAPSAPSSPPQK